MDRNLVILIGAGSSICGAAAVLATEPVVRGKSEHVAIAIASVVLYGTLSIFLYPVLYHIGQDWHFLHLGESTFGVYAGSTVHEVAQVVAAARNVSEGTAHAAVITKMVRVMMLAPFLALLSFYLARSPGREEGEQGAGNLRSPMRDRIKLPWFALVFVGVVALNSMGIVSASSAATLGRVDTIMLAMAMGALGLTTRLASIRKAGFKPLLLGALLYAWLIFGGALLNGAIQSWLGTTVR
jgi:uncharacterized integral membrane protein (TIGR00698 family)